MFSASSGSSKRISRSWSRRAYGECTFLPGKARHNSETSAFRDYESLRGREPVASAVYPLYVWLRVYAPTDTRSPLTESVRVIARQRGDVRTRVTARSWFAARFSTRHAAAIEGAPRSAESSHSRAIQSNHAVVAESPSYFSIVHRGSPNLSFRFPARSDFLLSVPSVTPFSFALSSSPLAFKTPSHQSSFRTCQAAPRILKRIPRLNNERSNAAHADSVRHGIRFSIGRRRFDPRDFLANGAIYKVA